MWNYEKRLQYPVKITQTNPKIAQIIITQFGGPDGELAASMRYLSQRYTMPYKEVTGTLTDIGTEELAHMEMICAIVYQLTKDSRGNRAVRLRQILCGPHPGPMASGRQRHTMERNCIPVQGGSYYRPARRSCRRAEGAHHV